MCLLLPSATRSQNLQRRAIDSGRLKVAHYEKGFRLDLYSSREENHGARLVTPPSGLLASKVPVQLSWSEDAHDFRARLLPAFCQHNGAHAAGKNNEGIPSSPTTISAASIRPCA
jgi:hypothetical protein